MCTNILRTVVFLVLVHATTTPAVHASERVVITAQDQFNTLVSQCGQVVLEGYRRIGLDACLRRLPNKRSLNTSNSGRVTGELLRVIGMEDIYPNLVRVPVIICRSHVVAFTKSDTIEIKGWESLSPYRIGHVIGMKRIEKLLSDLDVDPVVTTDSLMMMLDIGRLDVAVTERQSALEAINRLGLTDIREVYPPLNSSEFFTYIHKDRADLVPGLTSALSAMTEDGTMARLNEQGDNPETVLQRLVCK
jgi:polar amino acid transport system substrate-binding protein